MRKNGHRKPDTQKLEVHNLINPTSNFTYFLKTMAFGFQITKASWDKLQSAIDSLPEVLKTILSLSELVKSQGDTILSLSELVKSQGDTILSLRELVKSQGDTIISQGQCIDRLESKLDELNEDFSYYKTEATIQRAAVMAKVVENQSSLEIIITDVKTLIGEVGRLSSRGELMLSVFGFCHLYDLSYTRGELTDMGKKATKYSNQNGFKVEAVADNTFGTVNVYERRALEDLFL